MGLIKHYLRVFIRSHFRPIHPVVAEKWAIKTSIFYFLTAWTTLGFTAFYFKKGLEKGSDGYSDGQLYTVYDSVRKFGAKTSTIVHIKGLHDIQKEVLSYEEAQKND